MIRAEFCEAKGNFTGFRMSGHAGYAESGQDVVCAAVSSAVQLTVNVLIEFGHAPEVNADENDIVCTVKKPDGRSSRMIGLLMQHFEAILEEFPNTIKITTTEV